MDDYAHLILSDEKLPERFALEELYSSGSFVDVTLVCDDARYVKAHKVILSSASKVFRALLELDSAKCSATSILYLRGIHFDILTLLTEFIYKKEVKVHKEDLQNFVNIAKEFQIIMITDNYFDENMKDNIDSHNRDTEWECNEENTMEIDIKKPSRTRNRATPTR